MDEKAPLTDASLARLAMSREARKISDAACDLVPVAEGELRGDGSGGGNGHLTGQALELCEQARELLERTVVYERLGGASWETLGAALGIAKQSAHHRYSGAEQRFRQELANPVVIDEETGTLHQNQHPAAADPERTARALDEWADSHHPPVLSKTFDAGDGNESLVLGRLARMDEDTELRALRQQREQLLRASSPACEEDLESITRRERELLQRQQSRSRGTAGRSRARTPAASQRRHWPLP